MVQKLIKILIIIGVTLLMALPIIPLGDGSKKKDKPHALRFGYPYNKRNAPFIVLGLLECVVLGLVIGLLSDLSDKILEIDFINNLVSSIAKSQTTTFEFDKTIVLSILVNLVVIYIFFFIKAPLKAALKTAWAKKEEKKNEEEHPEVADETSEDEEIEQNQKQNGEQKSEIDEQPVEEKKTNKRVPKFRNRVNRLALKTSEKIIQINDKVEDLEEEFEQKPGLLKRIFFEGEHYDYGKPWVVLGESILSIFVKFLKGAYIFFFDLLLVALLFDNAPEWLYDLLIDTLHFNEWYLYPFISLIILQEICNTLYSKLKFDKKEAPSSIEQEEENEIENNVLALQDYLLENYDEEHYLRVFPYVQEDDQKEEPKHEEN